MLIGTPPPQWAQDLMHKWVELDDKYFGVTHNVFIFYADEVPSKQIRIFAEREEAAREDLAGKREAGLFATFIEPDGFKVIGTPHGLEKWTEDFIKDISK